MSEGFDGSIQNTVMNVNTQAIQGGLNHIDFSDEKSAIHLTQKKQLSQQDCATAQKVDILMTKEEPKFGSNIKINSDFKDDGIEN